jgi:hypothetical protein
MVRASVEYLGFRTTAERREYLLQCRTGPEIHPYTVGIPHSAFAGGRLKFQDGPEISFLKLQKELEASADRPAGPDFTITDAELADYRTAHTAPARKRGPAARDAAAAAAAGAANGGNGVAAPSVRTERHD